MTIYDATRAGRPVNPARALYRYWHYVLSNSPQGMGRNRSLQFGTGWRYCSIAFTERGPENRPNIRLRGEMELTHDGQFRLIAPHGHKQRNIVANHTFLRWGYFRSQYVWLVDTGSTQGFYGDGPFSNWREPVFYVSEKAMGAQTYAGPWSKLFMADDGWRIRYGGPSEVTHTPPRSQSDFDKFEALRIKRYRKMEHEHLVSIGVLKSVGRRWISEDAIEERMTQQAVGIAAHLVFDMPAKTTPLRKTTEEVA